MIYVDDDGILIGGKAEVEGIVYEGEGLAAGQCGLRFQNSGPEDFGRWSCTLISDNGLTFTGAVIVGELVEVGNLISCQIRHSYRE